MAILEVKSWNFLFFLAAEEGFFYVRIEMIIFFVWSINKQNYCIPFIAVQHLVRQMK